MRLAHLATLIAGLFLASAALAFEVEDRRLFEASPQRSVLKVISTADLDVFTPIILAFQADNPGIAVDYTVTGTTDLMRAIHDEGAQFDLAISSAMDLQTKLVNDGFAQAYTAPASVLPDGATCRAHLFAFAQAPAVLVVAASAVTVLEFPVFFGDVVGSTPLGVGVMLVRNGLLVAACLLAGRALWRRTVPGAAGATPEGLSPASPGGTPARQP